jgi:acyl-CoA reductase-like NAD-dependent aldehyde dehydrogenase
MTSALPVIDPARNETFAEVPEATAADVDAAVQAARSAFPAWAALAVSERGELVARGARHVMDHVEELVPMLTREQGKPLREARLELHRAVDTLLHYAGLAKALRGGYAPHLDPGTDGLILRRPLGVVAAIVPWNFPTTLLCNKLGPALVAGNTVVAKPAETTPLTTLRFVELLGEVGLPDCVLNVVAGGPATGEELVKHPDVRKVAFTGSTATGERIMALASSGIKRLTLELGGSDPLIVCEDADLARAASAASMGRFFNCGQACLAVKRVFLVESIADEVTEAIVAKASRLRLGPGDADGVQIGPLHSARQRELVAGQVERTLAAGGELACGGGPPDDGELSAGFFYSPTVVLEPPRDSPMAREEVFGPALAIWRVRCLDEAIERANDSPYGLGSSVWTADLDRARDAAERLDCGYTWINSPTKIYDELPFGGLKASGFGKEHGEEAFDWYTDIKSVVLRRSG